MPIVQSVIGQAATLSERACPWCTPPAFRTAEAAQISNPMPAEFACANGYLDNQQSLTIGNPKEGSITRTTTTTRTKKNGPYGVIACARLAMLPKNEMLTFRHGHADCPGAGPASP